MILPFLLAILCFSALAADPGAYAGDEACSGCHADKASQFRFSPHGRLKDFEMRGHASKCESCHGPGARHVEAGGDAALIGGFKGKEGLETSRSCLGCHSEGKAADWHGSPHAMAGVGCATCHVIHRSRAVIAPAVTPLIGTIRPAKADSPPPPGLLAKPEPELCFDCHREKRSQINYSSHHPIREGRMQCSSCHTVHGGEERLLASEEGTNGLCTTCHTAKQGPFVFEHAPVEEGCQTCHEPHGTVANNLLKQNEPFLCLQCHEAHFHIGRAGVSTPVQLPSGGSTNPFGASGWRQAFTTKCTQCHSQVHGSDLPSQSITSGGKALTR
jgi:predicted CXXCH cytochrome family protein